jgi:hypothetical protein
VDRDVNPCYIIGTAEAYCQPVGGKKVIFSTLTGCAAIHLPRPCAPGHLLVKTAIIEWFAVTLVKVYEPAALTRPASTSRYEILYRESGVIVKARLAPDVTITEPEGAM